MSQATKRATSADGTAIAYTLEGTSGPPVVLVDGAFGHRGFGPGKALAALLAPRARVVRYDRRGRGESAGPRRWPHPLEAERELEDLHALAAAVGGRVSLYGTSSGAMLALRAAASGLDVEHLVLHEPPLVLDGKHHPDPPDFREQIARFLEEDRRSDAVALFMRVVGVPPLMIPVMRLIPGVWKSLQATAHTLPWDFAQLGDTQSGGPLPSEVVEALGRIRARTLVLVGGKSPPWMHHATSRVADGIGGARLQVLPGQRHDVAPKAVAAALLPFLEEASTSRDDKEPLHDAA